jgi:hypothetical protein
MGSVIIQMDGVSDSEPVVERRRSCPRPLLVFASLLSLALLMGTGVWAFCFFSDEPVRVGPFAVYSLRRDSDRITYAGRMVFVGVAGQKWVVDSQQVTLSLADDGIQGLLSPKIHRLPGLVVTRP